MDELKKALKEGMERKPFEEGNVDVIEIGSKDTSTLLVSIPSLSGKVCCYILIKDYSSMPVATPLMLSRLTPIMHTDFIGTKTTP